MRFRDSCSVSLSCPSNVVTNRQSDPRSSTINGPSESLRSLRTRFARASHLLLIIQGEIPFGGRINTPALSVSFVSPVIFCFPLSTRGNAELSAGSFCPASSRTWNNLISRELRQPRPCTRMTADFGARPLDLGCGWSPGTDPSSDSSEDMHSN